MTTESNDLNRSESESDISAATQVTPTIAVDFSLGCKRVSGPTRRSTKGGWTSEEDELLTNAVQMNKGHTSWKKIVEGVPGLKDKRSEVQCQHRWLKVLDPNLCKGHWTKYNDRPQWSKISKQLPGRIGKQCRERWHNHLNPTIKKTAWIREEELILVQSQREHGNKWAEIAKLLPGRTENNIKNHWNCSVKKRLEQFPSNLSPGVLYGSRPSGFEYNFFNHKTLQIEEAAVKSPLRDSLELTLGPTSWRSTPSSTSSLRGDESISSSVESDWSSLNVSESTQETPQSSKDNECIQEVKEIKKRLRMAASTFNTPSIISKRSSPALKWHRQNELNTPFHIDGGSHMSSEEEHSTSPFSKYRLAKRNTCSGSKPLERRLDFDFM
ncbi:PREDICTED: myb-related protein 315-like isoform X2 [Camelina sativa]|uniref:Myb-related protein 315-like isoform X2 n=1 Tax=Camelina sativa TaxID=90675 RepID=A0ABM0T1P7_CAMSA|nr:PREDICTED: myb-related protein 315-like isoform X2 [Camelina sativa]